MEQLEQIKAALNSYHQNQETLTPLVDTAMRELGENWMKDLPIFLQNSNLDPQEQNELLEKANHAIYYHGALLAWQEASDYLSHPDAVDLTVLQTRLPILEYWLEMFGEEGADLLNQVKALQNQTDNTSVPEAGENLLADEVILTNQEEITPVEPVLNKSEDLLADTTVEPINANDDNALLTSVSDETKPEIIPEVEVNNTTEPMVPITPVDDMTPTEDVLSEVTNMPIETVEPSASVESVDDEEMFISTNTQSDEVANISVESVEPSASVESVDDEEMFISTNTQSDEEIKPISETAPIDNIQDKSFLMSENSNLDSDIQTNTVDEEMFLQTSPAPEENNTLKAIDPEDLLETSDDVLQTISEPKPFQQHNLERLIDLYENVSSWISARCIEMGNLDEKEYPYYGFLVDLMRQVYQSIDVLEDKTPYAHLQQSIKVRLDEVNEPVELTEDNLTQTDARQALGEIDTSNTKEYLGPAPDNFEAIDDPFTTKSDS